MAEKSASKMLVKKNTATAKAEEVKVVEQEVQEPTEATEAADTSEAQSISEDDLIVKTAKECETLKEDKAFKLVPQLLNNIDHDYFKLGGVLAVIQANGWFMDKGHENFRSFVESDCGIMYRKAMYLIQIYNGLVESGVKWEQVKHLGWTKLKELSGILTPENVDEWVGLAENMTVLQLQEHIKAESAGGDAKGEKEEAVKEASKTTTITFKVHADQKETIKEAIAKCQHETGTDSDAVAIEHICIDYLGGESKLAKIPSLKELMSGKSAEEVLEIFGEVFPDVELSATLPE